MENGENEGIIKIIVFLLVKSFKKVKNENSFDI